MDKELAVIFAGVASLCSACGLGMVVASLYGENMGAGVGFLSAPFLGLL